MEVVLMLQPRFALQAQLVLLAHRGVKMAPVVPVVNARNMLAVL
jgi:hypothetical protein